MLVRGQHRALGLRVWLACKTFPLAVDWTVLISSIQSGRWRINFLEQSRTIESLFPLGNWLQIITNNYSTVAKLIVSSD